MRKDSHTYYHMDRQEGKGYMNNIELKRCPFCGGQAELCQGEVMGRTVVYVKCKECHCFGHDEFEGWTMGFENNPSKYRSLEDAKRIAASNWNRRFKRHSN